MVSHILSSPSPTSSVSLLQPWLHHRPVACAAREFFAASKGAPLACSLERKEALFAAAEDLAFATSERATEDEVKTTRWLSQLSPARHA